jgi:WD40 repeat protein
VDEPLAAWKIGDEPLVRLAVSALGDEFAVVSRSGSLSFRDARTSSANAQSPPVLGDSGRRDVDPISGVTSIDYGEGGRVAIGARDGSVYLLGPRERMPPRLYAHDAWVSDVTFTVGGKSIATCDFRGNVRQWDINEGRELAAHSPGAYWLHRIATVGRDPTFLYAAGTDGSVYAWRAGQEGPPAQYGEPFTWHAVLALCVSEDNRFVAAAGARGDIRIWDNSLSALARTLPASSTGASEHNASAICDIAFTPAANHLLSAGEDGTIRIWHRSTGRALGVVRAHEGAARAVEIAHGFVYSAGDDGMVRKWKVPLNE